METIYADPAGNYLRGLASGTAVRDARQQSEQRSTINALMPKAAAGDQGALTQLAGVAPDQAANIQRMLAGQSEEQLKQRKQGLLEMAQMAYWVDQAQDPGEQQTRYQQVRQAAAAKGADVSKYPPQWQPGLSKKFIADAMTVEQIIDQMLPKQGQKPASVQEYEYGQQNPGFSEYQKSQQQRQPPTPYYSPVQTSQGLQVFDARTGQFSPMQQNGQPLMPPSIDPAAQGAVAGAKAQATEIGKGVGERINTGAIKARDANDTLGLLAEAERLLPNATGSGVGAMADAAGAAVGYATQGSAEADQLDLIAGQLTSKVPRMEGPQSNFDVQMYRQMAGDLGNRKIPAERRMAALQKMRELAMKYANQQQAGQRQVQRTGRMPDGRRVIQYTDGTTEVQ